MTSTDDAKAKAESEARGCLLIVFLGAIAVAVAMFAIPPLAHYYRSYVRLWSDNQPQAEQMP